MLDQIRQFLSDNSHLLFWVGVGSLVMFIGAGIGAAWLVARIPHDYFVIPRKHRTGGSLAWNWFWRISKNIVGWILIVAGIAMLLLPGQGVLTILAGLTLVDFYGKRRLEIWILSRRSVRTTMDWLRRRSNQPPLLLPASEEQQASEESLSDGKR